MVWSKTATTEVGQLCCGGSLKLCYRYRLISNYGFYNMNLHKNCVSAWIQNAYNYLIQLTAHRQSIQPSLKFTPKAISSQPDSEYPVSLSF